MNSEKPSTEYPRKDYEEAQEELAQAIAQEDQIHQYYSEELGVHDELSRDIPEGEVYQFADEQAALEEARKVELAPLIKREEELKVKLRRLYNVAFNEAAKKENADSRLKAHHETLPAVREMHEEIDKIRGEIEAFNSRAAGFVREAEELATSLEKLLASNDTSDQAEAEIRRLTETLVEAYGRITSMEHAIVHSSINTK